VEGPWSGHAFIGRASELKRLEDALDRAWAGRGTVVVIAGEAGVGKTRLVERFADAARSRDARVIEGACLDVGDGALPYAPFVEILREVRATEPGHLPALLGPARGEVTRLLPELATRAADLPNPAAELDPSAQSRLFELILGVFERIARKTAVVIVVEDVQWADRATLDLLTFLARALLDERVLLLVTARTDDLGRRGLALAALAELERDAGVERIELMPFGRDELAEQLESLVGQPADASVVDRILARSDGNPFYVEEFVAAGAHREAELPPRLRDVLAGRLAALPESSVAVLRAAAAAGRRIDDGLIGEALQLPADDLADALREAVASGLLSQRNGAGTSFAFRHALLQEFVAAGLFPGERVALHGAYARALEARAAEGGGTAPAAELARHWDAAGDMPRALSAVLPAAREADRVYAFADALRHWQRALELWPAVRVEDRPPQASETELLHRAAEAAVLAGEYTRAVELGRAAAASVSAALNPERAGYLSERLRWYLWEAGERDAAAAAVHEALVLLPKDPPSSTRARALAHLAGIEMYARDYAVAVTHAREAVDEARAAGALGEEAMALGVLGWGSAVLGDVNGGIEIFHSAMAIADQLGSVEGLALGASNLASLLDRVGRSAESHDAAVQGYETVAALGVGRTYGGLLLGFAAKAQLALGRWDEAEKTTTDGLRRGATGRAALWLLINRARVLLGRGRFDEAGAALERARGLDAQLGESEFRSALLAAEAELAVWSGRPADARAVTDVGLARARPGELPDPSLAWLAALGFRAEADLAEAARARHDAVALSAAEAHGDAIGQVVAGGLAAARGIRHDAGRGEALTRLIAAEQARLSGRSEPPAWAAVAVAWERAGRPFPTAYARYREAEAILATRGPRAGAQAAAREALDIAGRLGAAPLQADVERLARLARLDLGAAAAGSPEGTSSLRDPAAAFGFTPRESEVLQLVAGGWTNQQIADALFISRKTASVHVSNILGKLGVNSRVEAAAIAHRLGLGRDAPVPPDAMS